MGMSEFKCVILAGGLGTRISEVTALRHKPMVEIQTGVHPSFSRKP
jgi:NDP-sugar pyrophosphorylase family protein